MCGFFFLLVFGESLFVCFLLWDTHWGDMLRGINVTPASDICRFMVTYNGNVTRMPNGLVSSRWRHEMEHFPRYWPFVRGIHRSPVNSPHKGQRRGALMFSLICTLNKRVSKQSWGWWLETPSWSLWRHCNVDRRSSTVMPRVPYCVNKYFCYKFCNWF